MVDPISIKISPYMMEFLKRRREFSDLEPMETDESVIEFSASKKRRFTELKEEMEKVTSQSYLLNNNQYEMFQASKELILSDVEKEFNVKGNLYHYATMAEIPVIFHVNQQTSISCVLSNDPKSIPVDSLITIDCNEPTSDCKEIMHDRKEKYKLVEYESWNIAMNHHIGIYLTDKWEEEYSWIAIFNNCLKTVFKNDSVSCTIGISLPDNVAVNFKEFSKSILTVFRNSSPNHERQIYILLFVVTEFMKTKIVEALKEISNSKSDVVSFQGITSSAANNPFTVDIKEGFITEIPVDVIVSSIHPSLDLKNGRLSKAILDKAGIQMQNECYRQYKYGLDFPKIAIANGYNLSAKYVFFGAIPPNEEPNENISIFIEKCLEKALDIGITSIAFPALGTGNLNYSPQKVAAEMESAIAKFQAKPQQGSLKKILIIIYPEGQKGKETLSIFKDTFAKSKDSKEAIPKRRQELSHLKYDYDHLQWVQFLNYSGKRDRLDQAVHHFEKCLLNPSEISYSHYEENSVSIESTFDSLSDGTKISATQSEVKELLLFYDLPSKIKTAIKEQFDSDLLQNSVLVPRNYADEFKKYLNELRTLTYNDKLHIPSEIESSQLQHHVEKICQQYSPIKCAISSDEKQVLFRGLTFENIQAAKHQLELFLGLRENVSVSHDRFNTSESNAMSSSDYKSKEFQDVQDDSITYEKPEDRAVSTNVQIHHKPVFKSSYEPVPSGHRPRFRSASSLEPSYDKTEESSNKLSNISHQQKQSQAFDLDSQNKKTTQDKDCFTIKDGFIVKIYQGNILTANVEGIVNAANKYLMHGAGLARAIIKAAGDDVHTEGQAKLMNRKLNDGDVLSTSSGNLTRYKYIIHAVGPMRSQTTSDDYCRQKVAETVFNSLEEATRLNLSSVALPAISSAIFAVPIDICTAGYFNGVMDFCDRMLPLSPLKEVHFVDLNQTTCDAIRNRFASKLGNDY